MNLSQQPGLAHITYRATVTGGRDAEIRVLADPAGATLADAWARFRAVYADVDPLSLEIEIRELPSPAADAAIQGRPAAMHDAGPREVVLPVQG